MAKIVVLGAGVIGLSLGMMVARQGHDVSVFERDDEPVPSSTEDAWLKWERRGVGQFRQAHYIHSAARQILDQQLPEVTEALLRAGCLRFDVSTLMPPSIADRARLDDDDRFETITGRRTTIEYAVASTAETQISVQRGVSIAGLLTGPSAAAGIPHVTGVRAANGAEITADLVVDATGRNSRLPEWLTAAGARRPIEEPVDHGFIYYTRHFRTRTGAMPACRAGLRADYPSFSLLALPGDSGTWCLSLFIYSGDQGLKALRDLERWTALVAACPQYAHWLDGEPISELLPLAGVADRYRRFVVDGMPVATGIISVGDSWACTNPIGGRGISMGLMHAAGTAEVIQQHLDDPLALALEQDAMTEARVTPWYRDTFEFDRQRHADITAAAEGRPAPILDEARQALLLAMPHDPVLFRGFLETVSLLALPEEVMARPGVTDRIAALAGAHERPAPPCPSRDELVRMLA